AQPSPDIVVSRASQHGVSVLGVFGDGYKRAAHLTVVVNDEGSRDEIAVRVSRNLPGGRAIGAGYPRRCRKAILLGGAVGSVPARTLAGHDEVIASPAIDSVTTQPTK